MLKMVLSREECSKCRICCVFDKDDLWEAPLITPELAQIINNSVLPNQEYKKCGDCLVLDMQEDEEGLYTCNLLDHQTGCMLKSAKPFDCSIWPLRIMQMNGRKAICVSPVCPVVNKKSDAELICLAQSLSDYIFKQAELHPEFVKQYIQGYKVLYTEK